MSYEDIVNTAEIENTDIKNEEWQISIPKIRLVAPIQEDTTEEVLKNNVGHFIDSATFHGNIGLAGHNDTFFKDLKEVEIGDKVIYQYYDMERIYTVNLIEKINSRNWSYLKKTNDNILTLITCIENRPDLRLCIQAIAN